MPWRDRIIQDGTDRAAWLAAHDGLVTASDFQKLAKPESVGKYLAAKLRPRTFHGNTSTEDGHRWEPMMLAWAGIPHNEALIRCPDHPLIAATPDGITADGSRLAEVKVKHARIVDGPSTAEWRQIAGQFLCVPEAESLEFVWVELDETGEIREGRRGEPRALAVRRDDPRVVAALGAVLPIALDLAARLAEAREFEKELMSA